MKGPSTEVIQKEAFEWMKKASGGREHEEREMMCGRISGWVKEGQGKEGTKSNKYIYFFNYHFMLFVLVGRFSD